MKKNLGKNGMPTKLAPGEYLAKYVGHQTGIWHKGKKVEISFELLEEPNKGHLISGHWAINHFLNESCEEDKHAYGINGSFFASGFRRIAKEINSAFKDAEYDANDPLKELKQNTCVVIYLEDVTKDAEGDSRSEQLHYSKVGKIIRKLTNEEKNSIF